MITTCTTCGDLYEAGSEEQANEPERFCFTCRSHLFAQPSSDPGARLFVLAAAMLTSDVGRSGYDIKGAFRTVGRAKVHAGNVDPGLVWTQHNSHGRSWTSQAPRGASWLIYTIQEVELES
jgi:hypothetical protein